MISEKVAIRGFSATWRNELPLLTPYFVRVFNASLVMRMTADPLCRPWPVAPVPRQTDTPDFVAEVAMQLAKRMHEKGQPVASVDQRDTVVRDAWAESEEVVDRYEGIVDGREHPFNGSDFEEARSISANVEAAAACLPGTVEYSPKVRGAGILSGCEADLSVGQCLVEVKAVDRRFAAKDLKQLLVYLALDALAGRRWLKGCLLNPRRATWCQFNVEELVRRLSGGRPSAEVLPDLIDGMRRDVETGAEF